MTYLFLRKIKMLVVVATLVASTAWAGDGPRFVKLDATGRRLLNGVAEWAMVQDNKTGLVWEVKTTDGSVHDKDNLYSWKQAEAEFITALNKEKFGGFSDWRIPKRDELLSIRDSKQEPNIDTAYFPNTVPSRYWSYYICGDGSFIIKKIRFGKGEKPRKGSYVRAVRGGNPG